MRKLIWYVVLSGIALVWLSSTGGCGAAAIASSLCDSACLDYNALHCGSQCDCNACAEAPPACDSYFNCIQAFSGTCLELLVDCPIPSQCQPFVTANCP